MAHNLNENNGKTSFYSLREPAWHGLGQVVERPVTDDEALHLAGLDWQVELAPLCRHDMVPVETHHATLRGDTRETLGVVGKGWTPVQNAEMFAWLRGLDGVTNVVIETAGALGNGSTVWVSARCQDLVYDLGDGPTQAYMLLSNGHAGNRRMGICRTATRVVCANTLRLADGDKLAGSVLLRHSANVVAQMDRIQEAYAATTKTWKMTEESMRFLASKPLSTEALARLFVEPWIPKPSPVTQLKGDDAEDAKDGDESQRALLISKAREERLHDILASATCNIGTLGDTLYAGLQAVTEYLTHEAPSRGKSGLKGEELALSQAASRFESNNFGGAMDDTKDAAFRLALELANT